MNIFAWLVIGLVAGALARLLVPGRDPMGIVATIALGAKFASLGMVSIGTTLGMMVANVPAVLLGEKLCEHIPLSKIRFVAAALFAIFGALILVGVIGVASFGP